MCFLFSFNLPFFATSTQTEKDNRMLWNGKIPLRRRHDLSFLHLEDHDKHRCSGNESSSSSSSSKNELFLVEGVCSIVVTGRTDRYWTAACLNDDLSEEDDEPRLTIEDEDDPDMDTEKDPIILKVYNKPVSPRAYALAALATSLTKIADYHKDIQHQFGTSLNHHVSCPLSPADPWIGLTFSTTIDSNVLVWHSQEQFISADARLEEEIP